MHGFQLWANLPVVAEDDRAALPGGKGRRHSRGHRRRRHARARRLRQLLGQATARSTASRPIRSISMSRCRRAGGRTLPVETTRHAFAYVFAGSGKFCNASGPLAVPTEAVGWSDTAPPTAGRQPLAGAVRSRRRGHGAGRRRRHSLPAGLGQAARGARRVVRPDRHEHAGATAARPSTSSSEGTFLKSGK